MKKKKLPKYPLGGKKPIVSAAIENDPNYIGYEDPNSNNNLTGAQYAAIGGALAGGGANTYNNFNNPQASIRQKSESLDGATVGVASAINPLVGGIIAGVNTIAKPMRTEAEKMDAEGNLLDRNKARNTAIIGGLLDPIKAFEARASYKGGFGDISGKGYLNSLEAEAKAKLPKEEEIFNKDYQQDAAWQRLNNYQQFAMGGSSNTPNAEVEKQEVLRDPNGQTMQVNGASHAQGGVPVNIPPGTQIFSDRLKLPGSKKTIAKEAEQYKTNKQDKVLSDPKASKTAVTTAKLIADIKQRKLDELFQAQEALKQAKVLNYAKKLGVTNMNSNVNTHNNINDSYKNGGMKNCYPNGGSYNPYSNEKELNPQVNNTNNPAWNWNYLSPTNPQIPTQTQPIEENYIDPNTSYSNSMRNRNIAEGFGNGLVQNAGNFYDLYMTNMGKNYTTEDYGKINPIYTNPSLVSATESLRDADRVAAASRYALRNAVGGNSGAYLANLSSNQTANTLNKAKIRESVNNTNTGILNDANVRNTTIQNDAERYNLDLKNRGIVDTAQNKARAEDITRQAIRGLGENFSASYRDYKSGELDQKKLALVNQAFPNYQFNPSNFEFYYKSALKADKSKTKKKGN